MDNSSKWGMIGSRLGSSLGGGGYNIAGGEVAGMFRDLWIKEEEKKKEKRDAKRQRKRDKYISPQAKEAMKASKQARKIAREKQAQAVENHQLAIEQLKRELDQQKREVMADSSTLMMKQVESIRNNYAPGQKDSPEVTTMYHTGVRLGLEATGMPKDQVRFNLMQIKPFTAPDDEATMGQKIQGAISLVNIAPGIAGPLLGKLIGTEIDPNDIKGTITPVQEKLLMTAHQGYIDGIFDNPGDYKAVVSGIIAGEDAPYAGIKTTPKAPGPMPAGGFTTIMDNKLMERDYDSKAEAKLTVNFINSHTKEKKDEVKLVELKTKMWGSPYYRIVLKEEEVDENDPRKTDKMSTPESYDAFKKD